MHSGLYSNMIWIASIGSSSGPQDFPFPIFAIWGSYINMANSVDEKVDGTWSIRFKIQSIDMTMTSGDDDTLHYVKSGVKIVTFRPRAISRGGCGREPRMAVSELNFIPKNNIFPKLRTAKYYRGYDYTLVKKQSRLDV